MSSKYLHEIYINGYYCGIESVYKNLDDLIPRSLSNQELILYLMGVRDGITLIKYPEKRLVSLQDSFPRVWQKICTKKFTTHINTVYFHRKKIQKYLLEKCTFKKVGHYKLLEKVKDDRWMSRVSLCKLVEMFDIPLVDILLQSRLKEYLEVEAKYRYTK